jgi:hypothetical protein
VLEVPLPDDQAQTERILMMQSAACDGSPRATFDVTPWVAFQSWLSAQAPYRVRVPYARALVALVPTRAVRMRRDFPQLLSCIQTIAVLHQMQRARADDGAIIATLDDYVAARDLLSPIFDSTAADGITPAIRETVEAVPEGGPEMSTSALRAKLKVEKGTISWRVNRAIKQGWLKNLETKKGHPARLVRGEPLPAPAVALPPVERVREVFESSQSDLSRNQSTSSNEVFECSNGFPGEGAPPVFEVGEL